MEPYSKQANNHRTVHTEDNIFVNQRGKQTMMALDRLQKCSNAGGLLADIVLAVDPDAMPRVF